MAKPSLLECLKFRLLTERLGIPRVQLLGHLEMMWLTAHASGNPTFPSSRHVEAAAEWSGDAGAFAEGMTEEGFLDTEEDGSLTIHDYLDHAPEYVKARFKARQKAKGRRVPQDDSEDFKKILKNSEKFQNVRNDSENLEPNNPINPINRSNPINQAQPDTTDTDTTEDVEESDEEESAVESREVVQFRKWAELRKSASAGTHVNTLAQPVGASLTGLAQRLEAAAHDGAEQLVSRALRAGQCGEEWRPWWREVISRLGSDGTGGLSTLTEQIAHTEDAQNPRMREAKGIGPMKDPKGYLVKAATKVCKTHQIRWPSFPD
jgi:hypothetical protein